MARRSRSGHALPLGTHPSSPWGNGKAIGSPVLPTTPAPAAAKLHETYPAATLTDVRRPTFTSFLDLARWSAAAVVFVGHLRDPLFLGYGDLAPGQRTAAVKLWYFVTGWHAEAVVVFFVLSGYLVGGLASAKIRLGRFSIPAYGVDRATRIYLAFLPALLLTVLLDQIGSHWLAGAGLYDHTQEMIREKLPAMGAFTSYMSWAIFGINAALLQTFFGPPFGSNQPLWTISAEFWFYVVFGLIAAALLRRKTPAGLFWVVLAVGVAAVLGLYFVGLMGLWVIGILAAFAPRGRHEQPIISALVLLALLVASRLRQELVDIDGTVKNYAVALSFCWLLISMRRAESSLLVRWAALNRAMADFSYSLYLIHFPALIFLLSALCATGFFPGIAHGYAPTDPIALALYFGVIGLIYAAAWLFAWMTERNTGRVRSIVSRHLDEWRAAKH